MLNSKAGWLAAHSDFDVVLIDTAGRMQDNEVSVAQPNPAN